MSIPEILSENHFCENEQSLKYLLHISKQILMFNVSNGKRI